MKIGCGVIIACKVTGRILLGKRVDTYSWANFGGTLEEFETTLHCAEREILEETGLISGVNYKIITNKPVHISEYPGFAYHCFLAETDTEYSISLNDEHVEYKWVDMDSLPSDLHFGVADIFNSLKVKKSIAKIIKG